MIYQAHWIPTFQFNNLGWYNETQALELLKTLTVASYALCFDESCPPQTYYSWDTDSTIYVGIGGGTIHDWRGDRKNKRSAKVTLKSSPFDRVQRHLVEMNRDDFSKIKEEKYQDFYYLKATNPSRYRIWINILAPDPSLPKEILNNLRSELHLVESEGIYLYKNRHGRVPMMNREHESQRTTRKDDSISVRTVETMGDLTQWM